jgi:hypothetical protein
VTAPINEVIAGIEPDLAAVTRYAFEVKFMCKQIYGDISSRVQ